MPENTVYVGRPSLWGNPWTPAEAHAQTGFDPSMTRRDKAALAVDLYRHELEHFGLLTDYDYVVGTPRWYQVQRDVVASGARNMGEYAAIALRGKNLACWCPLDQPCHADVLLELANR
jgi:hypothetical protein